MTREFIILPEFDKNWKKIGLSDDDLKELENHLCLHPDSGDLIEGTGGLRKLRWRLPGRGKSGSIRTIYIDFVSYEKLYLITAYKKSNKENLSPGQKSELKQFVKLLLDELRKRS